MDYFSLIIILQAVLVGLFCSYVAGQKNRSKTYWFWLGFFFSFLALIALAAIPSLSKEGADYSLYSEVKNSIGTSPAQRDTVEFFDGDRNILNPAYQLFLTRKFGIEKNLTLEKYVIKNNVFNTLEDALDNANTQYEKELDLDKEKAELALREAQEQTAQLAQKQRVQVELSLEQRRRSIENALNDPKQLNAFDEKGKTPLMHAIEAHDIAAIKALIASGARKDQWGRNSDGELMSIKELAKRNGLSL